MFQLGIDSEPREDYTYELPHEYVISLDKGRYDSTSATARFIELVRAQRLRTVGAPFQTGRHYCLRVRRTV